MELLGCFAQGSVILLDKVPTNLILAKVTRGAGGGGLGSSRGRRGLAVTLELVLIRKGTVGRHGC